MIWWLLQRSRLATEKARLAELEDSVDWLHVTKWHATTDLSMCVDFRIVHGAERYSLQMVYPSVFPDSPPMIFTEDRTRISGHQYGADGELCLEYRPDNWNPSITGAEMVASCHRLLVEEHPGHDRIVHARSAHAASLGRDLRSELLRLVITTSDIDALNSLQKYEAHKLLLKERLVSGSIISAISTIGEKEAPLWISDLILPEGTVEVSGVVARVPEAGNGGTITVAELCAMLNGVNLGELRNDLIETDQVTRLLIGENTNWRLVSLHGEQNDRKICVYKTIQVPPEMKRVPNNFETLSARKLGIVGCGSIGSKIAASLCRSGIGEFLLIDEDIFFPANIIRNELDLRNIGIHKAYAVKERLLQINPRCEVNTLRISLGGQESSASMAGALETLGKCDLLIDATADSRAFNLIASVSTRTKTPMIWCQVFAGGIGGFIARARPDIDPIPIAARDQIQVWCEDQGINWVDASGGGDYQVEVGEETPMIANDAEVAIIASHACRFAIDLLVNYDCSIFPVSVYLIGLSSEWVFNEPFDTAPVALNSDGRWGEIMDPFSAEDMIELLNEHMPQKDKTGGSANPE